MAKRKQRDPRTKPKRKTAAAAPPDAAESPTSRNVTIFWMLAMLATLLAEIVALTMRLVTWVSPSETLLFFSNLMLFIAAVTGVICLLMTPVAMRWRDTPPPKEITRFAIAVSILPLVTLAAVLTWGR